MKLLIAFALCAFAFAEDIPAAAGATAGSDAADAKAKRGASEIPADAEKQEFQTDVRKMLDIIINSLYTNRNIFLRELISNSADALDKVRFLYLTEPKTPKTDAGEEPTMDIRITVDKEANTLTIRDGGVGMSKDDLVNNLGKIGASGTKQFLEKFQKAQGDMNLIGQFGVGFYSAFLAADRVKVASKNDADASQWVWDSAADGEFTLYKDPRGNTLGRGTEITLHLKEDADEFLQENRVRDIATRYSEFIHFPIFIHKLVEKKEEKKDDSEQKKDGEEVDAEKKAAADAEKDAKEPEMVTEWSRLNENPPVWTRKASDVTEDEYKKFYRVISKDYEDPLVWDHFRAEGEVEFKSILYIPSTAPSKMFEGTAAVMNNIKLYVRRVFITDEFKDMLPRYLSFICGVVDSDDLPLNVSRELLQESRILKIIKKKLIKKVLSMIKDVADKDDELEEEHKKKLEEAADEDAKKAIEAPKYKYHKLWTEFGKALRLGLIDDAANRARLAKLLRYKTTKAAGDSEWRSLEDYLADMVPEQNEIYYIVGLDQTAAELDKKPTIQRFKKANVEVILMTDPIDEYVVGHMTEFAGKKLVNLAKEDVKVPGVSSDIDRRRKLSSDFTDWFKKALDKSVERVVLSDRLVDAPAVVVSTKYGMTANMHQIMRGTPLGEQAAARSPLTKVLEININHPVVRALRDQSRSSPDSEDVKEAARLLYQTALFESGFPLDDAKVFIARMQKSLGTTLGVDSHEILSDEELPAEEKAAASEDEVNADEEEETSEKAASEDHQDDPEQPATATSGDEL